MEALLALLLGGEWAAAVLRLLVLPLPKSKATTIWKTWKAHLAHIPSHPIGETQTAKSIMTILGTAYSFPPAALEAI